jgi:hypothetical protein
MTSGIGRLLYEAAGCTAAVDSLSLIVHDVFAGLFKKVAGAAEVDGYDKAGP